MEHDTYTTFMNLYTQFEAHELPDDVRDSINELAVTLTTNNTTIKQKIKENKEINVKTKKLLKYVENLPANQARKRAAALKKEREEMMKDLSRKNTSVTSRKRIRRDLEQLQAELEKLEDVEPEATKSSDIGNESPELAGLGQLFNEKL